MVTAATIYMSLLGFEGLRRVASKSYENTAKLVAGLCAIDGVERLFQGPHFHEVALRLDRPVAPDAPGAARGGALGVTAEAGRRAGSRVARPRSR